MFQTYIKTNLLNNFIKPFKFSLDTPIFLKKNLRKALNCIRISII